MQFSLDLLIGKIQSESSILLVHGYFHQHTFLAILLVKGGLSFSIILLIKGLKPYLSNCCVYPLPFVVFYRI